MDDEDLPDGAADEEAVPETDDAASADGLKRRRKRQQRDQDKERDFWRAVLADETGRKVIWAWLAEDMHAFNERFACGPNGFPQVEATWFRAGEQAAGLRLYHRLFAIDPAAMHLMHREHDPRFAEPKPPRRTTRTD